MMAVAVDITPQVSARQVLEQAQAEREALLRELERASRAKDEFLAMLGHELRNPLAPILTALQLMRLRGVQGADKERAVIERQVKHVVASRRRPARRLANHARQDPAQASSRVRLAEVVAKAIEMASPLIEQRRHRLTRRRAGRAGGRRRWRPAVAGGGQPADQRRQIHRAGRRRSRSAPSGTTTTRGCRCATTASASSRRCCARVFDPFAQERQNSDRSQGGLGLGLAIVKKPGRGARRHA